MIWAEGSEAIGEKPVPLSLCTVSAREFTTVTWGKLKMLFVVKRR
jgi:hypothetical protein